MTDQSADDRIVAVWLLAIAAMVFVMVVLGGVTRLTESGLSMVNWRPVTGILPPLTAAEWDAVFALYRDSPEFRRVNFWMTVADFKSIFWLEYVHRLWGRLIGAVFLLPFLYLWFRGRIRRDLAPRLALLFVLGGAQGLLGWYMVKSGLVERPDVSHYRLAAHLGLAIVIYGALLWTALELLQPRLAAAGGRGVALANATLVWIFVLALSGALVAGLDAGHIHNSFPLMEGRLIPATYGAMSPWYVNPLENAAAVQFNHRLLAVALVIFVAVLWWRQRRAPGNDRQSRHLLLAAALLQAGLGISALLLSVPVALGALHQAGALVLFSAAIWHRHAIARSA